MCLFFNSQITNFFISEPSLPLQEKLFQDKINKLSRQESVKKNEVLTVAESFIGAPYKSMSLLEISLDSVNSLSLVDQIVCIVLTSRTKEKSFVLFETFLNKIYYLDGGDKIEYFLQWKDNLEKRGVLCDVTPLFSSALQAKKQLSGVSKKSPASDRKKLIEKKFSNTPFYYIPTSAVHLIQNQLHNGDIIAIISKDKNKEINQIGIIKIINEEPYLIYTKVNGSTQISDLPLKNFLSSQDSGLIIMHLN